VGLAFSKSYHIGKGGLDCQVDAQDPGASLGFGFGFGWDIPKAVANE